MAFDTDRSVQDVLTWYDGHWKRLGLADVSRGVFDGASTLGVANDEFFYSVQVRESLSGGAEGAVVISRNPTTLEPDFDTQLPLMPGARIVSRVESNDFGQMAQTMVVAHERRTQSVSNWYRMTLPQTGWREAAFGNDGAGLSYGPQMLNFQRGGEQLQISIVDADIDAGEEVQTMTIMNWVK